MKRMQLCDEYAPVLATYLLGLSEESMVYKTAIAEVLSEPHSSRSYLYECLRIRGDHFEGLFTELLVVEKFKEVAILTIVEAYNYYHSYYYKNFRRAAHSEGKVLRGLCVDGFREVCLLVDKDNYIEWMDYAFDILRMEDVAPDFFANYLRREQLI